MLGWVVQHEWMLIELIVLAAAVAELISVRRAIRKHDRPRKG